MGLFEFWVLDEEGNRTGEIIEEIFKASDVPNLIRSSSGRWAARKMVSVIAKPSKTETSVYGVNGTFNRGLGEVIYSNKHYDQVCERKGLIPESQFSNRHIFADLCEKKAEHDKKEDAEYHRWEAAMAKEDVLSAKEGTREYTEKWERVWDTMLPAHEVLDNTITIS